MTRPVIVSATTAGTARWPLSQRRSSGPSFSSMNVLNALNARKKPSDVRPLMPTARPFVNTAITSCTEDPRSFDAVEAPESFMPRSWSHCWNLSAAALASAAIAPDCARTPPMTRKTISTAIAITISSTTSAPRARGTRWPCIQDTAGLATVEMTSPTRTGTTIVDVIPSTHVRPTSSAATPTSSQDAAPRSRSQRGDAKTAESCLSWSASSVTTVRVSPSSCACCDAASAAPTSSSSFGRFGRSLGNRTSAALGRAPASPPVAPNASHGPCDGGLAVVEDLDRDPIVGQPVADLLDVRLALRARQEQPFRKRVRCAPAAFSLHHGAPHRDETDRAIHDARLMHVAVQVEVLGRELRVVRGVDTAAALPEGDVVRRVAAPRQPAADARPHAVAAGIERGVGRPDRVEHDAAEAEPPAVVHDGPRSPADDGLEEVGRGRG